MNIRINRTIICLTLLLASQSLSALSPRFDLYVEWGYTQSLFGKFKYNILSSEGGRLYDSHRGAKFCSNGDLLAGVMMKLGQKNGITFLSGYSGVPSTSRIIPLELRYSYFCKGFENDGFFTFAEGGIGLKIESEFDTFPAYMAVLGSGYRLKLSPGSSIDFLLEMKSIFDRPKIPDPEGQGYVKAENILSNMAYYYGLNLSVALSF